jgi:hypothetical protein
MELLAVSSVFVRMDLASYYRYQADSARRLARVQAQHESKVLLQRVAQEYDALADSSVEIPHSGKVQQHASFPTGFWSDVIARLRFRVDTPSRV